MSNYIKNARIIMILGYAYFILTKTIIGRTVLPEPILRGLFWEIREGYWINILMNILLFIPLGFLIGGWKGLVAGFLFSCTIESIQFFGRLGFCELDDVLNNTIGSGLGVIINMQLRKCIFSIKEKTSRNTQVERDL